MIKILKRIGFGVLLFFIGMQVQVSAQSNGEAIYQQINMQAEEVFDQVVECRRHFHENPELSNRRNSCLHSRIS